MQVENYDNIFSFFSYHEVSVSKLKYWSLYKSCVSLTVLTVVTPTLSWGPSSTRSRGPFYRQPEAFFQQLWCGLSSSSWGLSSSSCGLSSNSCGPSSSSCGPHPATVTLHPATALSCGPSVSSCSPSASSATAAAIQSGMAAVHLAVPFHIESRRPLFPQTFLFLVSRRPLFPQRYCSW
jgi:hypothetical protein